MNGLEPDHTVKDVDEDLEDGELDDDDEIDIAPSSQTLATGNEGLKPSVAASSAPTNDATKGVGASLPIPNPLPGNGTAHHFALEQLADELYSPRRRVKAINDVLVLGWILYRFLSGAATEWRT